MIELVIATINYRTPELTISCVESVLADQDNLPAFKIYVVDNASPDNSIDLISEYISARGLNDQVELIQSDINGGFAYGNNLVMRKIVENEIDPSYLWVLNPDTLVRPNAGKYLIDFLKENPKAAVAGSGLENEERQRQTSAFRFPSPVTELIAYLRLGFLDRLFPNKLVSIGITNENLKVDWVSGASFILKVDCLRTLGMMDEVYFLYYEEVDYFMAINKAGYEIWHVPSSLVFHVMGASTGFVDHTQKSKRRPEYWFESRRRFFIKNYGKWGALRADVFAIIGYTSWRLRRVIQRKQDLDPPEFLNDLVKNSVLLKGFELKTSRSST